MESLAMDEEELCDKVQDVFIGAAYAPPVVEEAVVQSGATSMSFAVPHRQTITSGGRDARVTLAVVSLGTTTEYITRPRLGPVVYAQLTATNASAFTLLAGPASVFVGQQFISRTAIGSVASGETFTVSLGVDEAVTASQRRVKSVKADEGGTLTRRRVRLDQSFVITVKNRKRMPVAVLVEDQVPVSAHSDIVVDVTTPAPPPKETEALRRREQEGLVQWRITLAPQEERQLAVEFSVTRPADMQIEGI
jgi:uncharacterized protein (TIGR02231 family)